MTLCTHVVPIISCTKFRTLSCRMSEMCTNLAVKVPKCFKMQQSWKIQLRHGLCTFCEIKFHDLSMENQWNSMTFSCQKKVKSYANWWKFLYLQVSFNFSLNYLTQHFHFPWLFGIFLVFCDFSRSGNTFFQIPWLFQVFHDRTTLFRSQKWELVSNFNRPYLPTG